MKTLLKLLQNLVHCHQNTNLAWMKQRIYRNALITAWQPKQKSSVLMQTRVAFSFHSMTRKESAKSLHCHISSRHSPLHSAYWNLQAPVAVFAGAFCSKLLYISISIFPSLLVLCSHPISLVSNHVLQTDCHWRKEKCSPDGKGWLIALSFQLTV